MSSHTLTPVLAGAYDFAHPMISAVTIFLLTMLVAARWFGESTRLTTTSRLAVLAATAGSAVLGAIVVAGAGFTFSRILGVVAIALATTSAVGGFLVAKCLLADEDGVTPPPAAS